MQQKARRYAHITNTEHNMDADVVGDEYTRTETKLGDVN